MTEQRVPRRDASAPDGRSSRWDAHRVQRREELLDAAIRAVGEFGPEVGMDQIAATAGTSKPVVYRYFADKFELYRAMGERIIGVIVRALERTSADLGDPDADPRVLVRAGIDAYLALLDENPQLFRFVTGSRALHEARGGEPTPLEYARPIAEVLTAALGRHLRTAGLDPVGARPWGEAVVGFIQAASLWWVEHRDAMTRDELAAYLTALLWGGIAGVLQGAGQDLDARPPAGIFAPDPGPRGIGSGKKTP